jgi:hypothetical protein
MKLIPEHLPKHLDLRNNIIGTATLGINSTNRLYEIKLGKQSFK